MCDGDESYENFARNRMEHVGGQMYKTQAGTDAPADMILSQGDESCPTWAWSHSEYARFTHKLRIPENAEGKCVFGWFWLKKNLADEIFRCRARCEKYFRYAREI